MLENISSSNNLIYIRQKEIKISPNSEIACGDVLIKILNISHTPTYANLAISINNVDFNPLRLEASRQFTATIGSG